MAALMAEHCRVVLAALVLTGCSPYERAREIRDERAFVARSEKMCAINSECDRNAWRREVAIELVERNLRANQGLVCAMTR